MISCPKCGAYHVGGPTYIPIQDVLRYVCLVCSYTEERLPKDRQEQQARISTYQVPKPHE